MNSVIKGASYVLVHTPDMVLYNGTTQTTERVVNPDSEYLKAVPEHLRSYEEAVSYWPNQTYIGNAHPDELAAVEFPYYDKKKEGAKRYGKYGEIMPEEEFMLLVQACDMFEVVRLDKAFVAKYKDVLAQDPNISDDIIEKINEGVERKEKVEVIKGRQFKREPDVKLKNFASWNIVDVQLSFDVDLTKIKENELLFLNSIIGGGDGSYLQTEIRENQGLVYDIYSCVDIFSKESILSIIFSIDKSRLQLSILEIIKILKQLKNIISKKDVDRNMAFFTENLWYWAEETKELNFQLGSDFLNDKEVLTIEDRIMANERIDFQRMREISEMIFRKENMSLIVIGPTKGITENKLRELLYGKYDNEYNEKD